MSRSALPLESLADAQLQYSTVNLPEGDLAQPREPAREPDASLLVCLPMREVPQRWRPRLRALSLGPVEGAMVRWSYHDGSTWTAVLFEGRRREPRQIVGWAVFTLQEAEHPIVGVYVQESSRGRGYATRLVSSLLDHCKEHVHSGVVWAVADWWPKYHEVFAKFGFECWEWD